MPDFKAYLKEENEEPEKIISFDTYSAVESWVREEIYQIKEASRAPKPPRLIDYLYDDLSVPNRVDPQSVWWMSVYHALTAKDREIELNAGPVGSTSKVKAAYAIFLNNYDAIIESLNKRYKLLIEFEKTIPKCDFSKIKPTSSRMLTIDTAMAIVSEVRSQITQRIHDFGGLADLIKKQKKLELEKRAQQEHA